MAHFAQLDENNMVIWVTYLDNSIITNENGEEQESLGIQHIHNTIPGSENYTWKQTSYNNKIRGKYATLKSMYLEELDVFTGPKPFDSWILNRNTLEWEPPIPKPELILTDSEFTHFVWNEETISWDSRTVQKPFDSWIFNREGLGWFAPIPVPTDSIYYEWDEENQTWYLEEPPQ